MMYLVKVLCADYNGEHIVGIFTSIAAAMRAIMDTEKELGNDFFRTKEENGITHLYFTGGLGDHDADYSITPMKPNTLYY